MTLARALLEPQTHGGGGEGCTGCQKGSCRGAAVGLQSVACGKNLRIWAQREVRKPVGSDRGSGADDCPMQIEGRSRGNHKQQPEPEAAGSGKGQMARDRGAQEPAGKRRKAEVVKKRETEAKDADEGDDRDNSSDDDVIDAADLGLGAASREVQDDTGSGAFLEEVLDDPDGDRHGAPAAGKAAHTGTWLRGECPPPARRLPLL